MIKNYRDKNTESLADNRYVKTFDSIQNPATSTEFASFQRGRTLEMSKLQTTTDHKEGDKLAPIHPGEILREEFLKPLNLSATKLATLMGVPATRVTAIVSEKEKRAITAPTALRLAGVFKTSVEFWLTLQSNYEVAMLDYTGEKDKIQKEVRELTTT